MLLRARFFDVRLAGRLAEPGDRQIGMLLTAFSPQATLEEHDAIELPMRPMVGSATVLSIAQVVTTSSKRREPLARGTSWCENVIIGSVGVDGLGVVTAIVQGAGGRRCRPGIRIALEITISTSTPRR